MDLLEAERWKRRRTETLEVAAVEALLSQFVAWMMIDRPIRWQH